MLLHSRLGFIAKGRKMLHPNSALNPQKSSIRIKPESLKEIEDHFKSFCENGQQKIRAENIGNVLVSCGEKVPAYKIRQALDELKIAANDGISFGDFKVLLEEVASMKISTDLVPLTSKASMQLTGGQSFVSAQGTQHSYDDDDKIAFAEWVNGVLEKDKELTGKV